MSLTQISKIDEITVTENGVILYRTNNIVMDGTNQLTQGYIRNSITPDSDLTNISPNVVAIANVVWTPNVIAVYKAQMAEKTAKQSTLIS